MIGYPPHLHLICFKKQQHMGSPEVCSSVSQPVALTEECPSVARLVALTQSQVRPSVRRAGA